MQYEREYGVEYEKRKSTEYKEYNGGIGLVDSIGIDAWEADSYQQ